MREVEDDCLTSADAPRIDAPHVVALHFRVLHGDAIDYGQAEPLTRDEPGFRLTVQDNAARFEFKEGQHHPTVESALDAVSDFIRAWEFDANLMGGDSESFRLDFKRAEIVDRRPTPGEILLDPLVVRVGLGSPKVISKAPRYPTPPSNLAPDDLAELLQRRFLRHLQDREPLAGVAGFCLSALEKSAGNRRKAASRYGIDNRVLNRIGDLAANKGGSEARKGTGVDKEFSSREREFLHQALRTIIRRTAEMKAAGQHPRRISLSGLPAL